MQITIDKNIIEKTRSMLAQPGSVVILSHFDPDGDAVGSALGLYHYLVRFGHQVDIIMPNRFPDFLKWLPASGKICIFQNEKKKCRTLIQNAHVIFSLDFNDIDRLEDIETAYNQNNAATYLIDHHPSPGKFAQCIISDTSVSSTAELLYEFLIEIDATKINNQVAVCLFTGILTDTGSFSYNCSLPRTYKVVADLLRYDINKEKINSAIYDNYSEERMRLLGHCLNNKLTVFKKYHTAIISISKEELQRYNFKIGDTEGFVNIPLSIAGIVFSALFVEKDGHIKISFRSKGKFKANAFARSYFNGGGHNNAAGGSIELSMEKAIEKFIELLHKHASDLDYIF
jgi:bifunctional oligoribonuclease and PAP phosphatase NrnA